MKLKLLVLNCLLASLEATQAQESYYLRHGNESLQKQREERQLIYIDEQDRNLRRDLQNEEIERRKRDQKFLEEAPPSTRN